MMSVWRSRDTPVSGGDAETVGISGIHRKISTDEGESVCASERKKGWKDEEKRDKKRDKREIKDDRMLKRKWKEQKIVKKDDEDRESIIKSDIITS